MAKDSLLHFEGSFYLAVSLIVCLCSMCLMLACWAIFGGLITNFYRIHVSENFGIGKEDDKKED